MSKKQVQEKPLDCFYSKLSLILGLSFWIPLLNYPLSVLAIFFGVSALRLVHKYPDRYGGRIYAVIGIILASLPVFIGLSILLIPTTRQRVLQELLVQNATGIFG